MLTSSSGTCICRIAHRIAPRSLSEWSESNSDRAPALLRRREGTRFFAPNDDEVGALQGAIRAERAPASEAINRAGVVELVDTQDLGSCAFGCEGSSPSFGTGQATEARSADRSCAQVGCRCSSSSGFWATPTSALGAPVMIAYVAPAITAPTIGPMMNSHT
jgi:hypothetical protein